jgi:hypothetical protein
MGHIRTFLIPPVRGVWLYKCDLVVVRGEAAGSPPDPLARGDITVLSRDSLRRLAFVAANTDATFRTMATLTYPRDFEADGAIVKYHLKKLLQRLKRRGMQDYLWFLEFQRRGAPHFHILLDLGLPADYPGRREMLSWLSAAWYEIVGSGDVRHLVAGTRWETLREADGGKRYALVYSKKPTQKRVPVAYRNVGRFWGHSTGVKPRPKAFIITDEGRLRDALTGWQGLKEDGPIYRVCYNAVACLERGWASDPSGAPGTMIHIAYKDDPGDL